MKRNHKLKPPKPQPQPEFWVWSLRPGGNLIVEPPKKTPAALAATGEMQNRNQISKMVTTLES